MLITNYSLSNLLYQGHKHVDEKSYYKKSFDESIEPHKKLIFENIMVQIPCIAPTNTLSKILKVEYVLRVSAIISCDHSLRNIRMQDVTADYVQVKMQFSVIHYM